MKKFLIFSGIAFLVLGIADGFMTFWAVNHGCIEMNPFVAPIAGKWIYPAIKIIAGILSLGVMIVLSKRMPRLAVFSLCFLSLVEFVVVAHGVFELLI